MPKVTYVEHCGTMHAVEVEASENVMRGALYAGIEGITGECGGALSCATCHVTVDPAWAAAVGGPSSDAESELLSLTAIAATATSRLSCQIVLDAALDGLVVHLPERQF